jgi:hypothetical protein
MDSWIRLITSISGKSLLIHKSETHKTKLELRRFHRSKSNVPVIVLASLILLKDNITVAGAIQASSMTTTTKESSRRMKSIPSQQCWGGGSHFTTAVTSANRKQYLLKT